MNRDYLHGVWSPALTPVTPAYEIDHARYVQHVQRLLSQGCHGIALFGTTGEATSFSSAQRIAALEAVLAAGVAPAQLLVGTGCAALADSIALTRHAVAAGCTNVLMLPPFYYKGVSDEGVSAGYQAVIDSVGDARLGVYLYHFPKLSGVPITHGILNLLLASHPDQVRGYKDSGGDFAHTRELIERFPQLNIFPGSERYLLDGLRLGGAGCITASANVNAGAARRVWDAFETNDDNADAHQATATSVREAIEQYAVIGAQKALLAKVFKDPEWNRVMPPLTTLETDQVQQLDAALAALDFKLAA